MPENQKTPTTKRAAKKAVKKIVKKAAKKAARRKQASTRAGPGWAGSMQDLGEKLNPPRDRKIIQRAMKAAKDGKLPPTPGRHDGMGYNIEEWEKYINLHFQSFGNTTTAVQQKEELQALDIRLKQIELAEAEGRAVSIEEAIEVLGGLVAAVSQQLRDLEETMSTRLLDIDTPGELKNRTRELHRTVLEKLSMPRDLKKKKGTQGKFWKTVFAAVSDPQAA